MCVRTCRWRRKEQGGGWWCRPEVSPKREYRGEMRCEKQGSNVISSAGFGCFHCAAFLDADVNIGVHNRKVNIPE